MEILDLIILLLAGIFTSFFATISGGGALVYIPLLIFFGLPPSVAIATNRFASVGTSASLYNFIKNKKVLYKFAIPLAIFSTIGAYIGARLMLNIDENLLKKLIAIIIILIVLLLIFKKDAGLKRRLIEISTKRKYLGYLLGFLIGVYAGFFGAAYATFFSYLLIFVFGLTFIDSAGTRALASVFTTITATIVFLLAGKVSLLYGIILFLGRAIGSFFGSGFAINHGGEKYARFVFIIFALFSGIKLLI